MSWTSIQLIKIRILVTATGFVLFLCALLFRSYQLQIPDNDRVDNLTQRQHTATIPVQPKRGAIYDRNGEILAMDIQVASIAVHPQNISDADKHDLIKKLSVILEMPEKKIADKLRSKRKFEWLARRIPADAGEQVSQLKNKAVSVVGEYRRFYPNKELAGHVLGSVGYDAKALGGIEMSLDTYLKSSRDKIVLNRDAKGRLITPNINSEISHDVYLTLDRNIQYYTEKYLTEQGQKFNAKSGFAIVTDPHTGDILAMANYPRFNPNSYWDYPMTLWKNRAVLDTFEPGSTFKTIMAAAALNSGKVKMSDYFNCENGSYKIGNKVIHDHEAMGMANLVDIIRVSSNIGITKVGNRIGKDAFYDTMIKLGFGKKTEIDFPGEESGRLAHSKKWKEIDQSNIAFGQGIAVNGLQMAMAYGAIANNGDRLKPHLISKIIKSNGDVVKENKVEVVEKVFTPKVTQDVLRLLRGVVHEEGTGRLAKVDGYLVGGKTGTAQKVNPQTKKYDAHDYVSSFIGMAPAEDPSYVIYVVFDSPAPIHTGGAVAAPVFQKIAQYALAYKGIAPTETQKVGVKVAMQE